ncbi:MAG: hypothetical protein AAFY88_10095 [Acidobacteriota bacterium]
MSLWNPRIFEMRPADEIEVRGLTNRHRTRGLGAPLVLNRLALPERSVTENGFYSSYWNFYTLSAVARFEDMPSAHPSIPGHFRRASLLLHDPLQSEQVEIGGVVAPLEADHTAPLAVLAEIIGPSLRDEGNAALRAERLTRAPAGLRPGWASGSRRTTAPSSPPIATGRPAPGRGQRS